MITVSVAINGQAIMTRSAVNTRKVNDLGEHEYLLDDGSYVFHKREDGAKELAKKMLDKIQEL